MTADQFLRQLQKWGVRYVEASGWRTRNRDTAGPWGPVQGVLLHHTGDDAPDDADQRVLTNGRPDLPGPLCHWGMRDDGTAVLIGWGRANHAGRGAANVRNALLTEDYGDRPPYPGEDTVDGNQLLYGQETMYSGAQAPTSLAYQATVRIFAAVCDFHGWSGRSCIGHKEWTSRKPDPGHLDMTKFRADVDALLEAGPAPVPRAQTHLEDEDMKVIRTDDGRMWITNGPFTAPLATPELAAAWCKVTGQLDDKGAAAPTQVPYGVPASTTSTATVALIQTLAGQAAANRPDVDEAALAADLAPMLHANVDTAAVAEQIVAFLPDDLAQQVADVLAQRLSA